MWNLLIFVAVFSLLSGFIPIPAPTAGKLLINEVLYDPEGSDAGHEWIELKNISNEEIDLSGIHIQIAGSDFITIFNFPEGTKIGPKSFILVGENSTEADFKIALLGIQNGGTSTDGIRLVDSFGNIIDTVLYDDNNSNSLPDDTGQVATEFAIDVNSGYSLCRNNNPDSNRSNADFLACSTLTPSEENILPTTPVAVIKAPTRIFLDQEIKVYGSDSTSENGDIVKWEWQLEGKTYEGSAFTYTFKIEGPATVKLKVTDTSGLSGEIEKQITIEKFEPTKYKGLEISEIFPAPKEFDTNEDSQIDDKDEFIELVNLSTHDINLSGLQIADATTFDDPNFTFDEIMLKPKQVLVLDKATTNITLNNTNEEIYLLGPAGQIIDQIAYKSSKPDISWNKSDAIIFQNEATPGLYVSSKGKVLAATGEVHPLLNIYYRIKEFHPIQKYDMLSKLELIYSKFSWPQKNLVNQRLKHKLKNLSKRLLKKLQKKLQRQDQKYKTSQQKQIKIFGQN